MAIVPRSRMFWLGLVLRLVALPFFGPKLVPIVALAQVTHLLFDICGLALLRKLTPQRKMEIYLYYWLNPALFVITYVQGRPDTVSTTLCLASIVAIIHKRIKISALLLGLAVMCGPCVAVILPLMLAYLWTRLFRRQALAQIGVYLAIWLPLSTVCLLPHLWTARWDYVLSPAPAAARLLALHIDWGPNHVLYPGLAVMIGVIGRLCFSTRLSSRGLLFGSGLVLGVLALVTGSDPVGFFAFMPAVALFFATYVAAPPALYMAVQSLYLTCFVILPLLSPALSNVCAGVFFTLLNTSIVTLLSTVWWVAVRREAPLMGRLRPLTIGIAGDSGAGKSTLTRVISELFAENEFAVLEGDDYHRWERGHALWQTMTHLDPSANDLETLASHTHDLRHGRCVLAPRYDHSTGKFTPPRRLHGRKLVLVEGLHVFYLRHMRGRLDLKVFLSPAPMVRLAWKIRRDVAGRGASVPKVLADLRRRTRDSQAHIDPQREHADWVIEIASATSLTQKDVLAGVEFETCSSHILWNDAPVVNLWRALRATGACEVHLESVAGNISRVRASVVGTLSQAHIAAAAYDAFPHLRHITQSAAEPRFCGGQMGVNQLITLALLTRGFDHDHPDSAPYQSHRSAA